MRRVAQVVGLCLCAGLLMAAGAQPASKTKKATQIARGKYIVTSVGLCGDCHTPMNEKGESLKEKHLQGAPVLLKPPFPIPNWAEQAPDLTNLKGWTEADLVKFLMTGIQPNGQPPNPPMPPYRLNREDAEAVTAYIRSLSPAPPGEEAKLNKK